VAGKTWAAPFNLALIPFALLLVILSMMPALIRRIGKGCLGGTLEGPPGSLFFLTGLKHSDISNIAFIVL
jgi:hypothetical protein